MQLRALVHAAPPLCTARAEPRVLATSYKTRQRSGTIWLRPGKYLAQFGKDQAEIWHPGGRPDYNALFIIDSILFWFGRPGLLPRTDVRAEPRTQHCISARSVSGPWLESCAMCHAYQHICAQVPVVAFYAYNFIACATPQCICICEPKSSRSNFPNLRPDFPSEELLS